MKVPPAQADRFAASPPAEIRAVLIYGPDDGLVRERSGQLLRSVVDDPSDPFRVVDLSGAELGRDPARLADEAAAIAMTGGRRVVRLRETPDSTAPVFKAFLDDPAGDALILVEAGDLAARAALRKLFEGAARGAALACYQDDARSLPGVIAALLSEQGLTASRDAVAYLASHLGGDRQVTRREVEKLALYKGAATAAAGGDSEIGLEDVLACVGDSASISLDDLAFALGDGDAAGLERSLQRSLQEGANPVAILRAAARHLQRLHLVTALVSQGSDPAGAMKRLRPPVFWKLTARFQNQARTWQPAALGRALDQLLDAEAACKRTGAPAELLAARALHGIAARAPGRRRRSA